MTPKKFWETLDRLDDMFNRKVIDKTQYSTDCVLLGWQWHHQTGKALPSRPREEPKGEYVPEDDGYNNFYGVPK